VIDYTKIYTLLSKDEIDELAARQKANPSAREAQKVLAREVTKLVHGEERQASVERVTDVLFGDKDVHELNSDDLDALAAEIPVVNLSKTIVEALVETDNATSNGEARRLILGGAVSVNGQKVTSDGEIKELALIKKGKNSFILLR
jgi:tyrosyl-tRNA synthetase